MNYEEAKQMLLNIADEETLKSNLSFTAFFIALYESFRSLVIDRIQGFLSDGIHFGEDGKMSHIESIHYTNVIKNRKNDSGEKLGVLVASMLWLVESEAITLKDYNVFIKIREQRNRFAHELTDCLTKGVSETEIEMFFELFRIYKTVDKWWINEIEIPLAADELPPDYDPEGSQSAIMALFDIMVDVLIRGKSDEHKELIQEYFKES